MSTRRRLAALLLAAAFLSSCKKEEPKPPAPAPKPAQTKPAPKPEPEPVPKPEPKKPAAKEPEAAKPVKASREVSKGPVSVMREIVDINSPEVKNSKLPVIAYYYANWSPHDKKLMGIVEDLALEFKGRAVFYRIDAMEAQKAKVVPKEVIAMPYLFFMKGGKRQAKNPGRPGGDAKKTLRFYFEDWISGGASADEEEEDEEF